MKINTQGVIVSLVMLAAAIWGKDTILPPMIIVAALLKTVLDQLSTSDPVHDMGPDHVGTRSVNWTRLPLWRRVL